MSEAFWAELANMLLAAVIVAALALPVGLLAWRSVRRNAAPVLPTWQPSRTPWGGFEVLVVFLVIAQLIPMTMMILLEKSAGSSSTSNPPLPPIESSAAVAGMPITVTAYSQAQENANSIRQLWAGALSLPLQLTMLLATCRILYPQWWFIARPMLAAQVLVGIAAWLILTSLVHGVHTLAILVFNILDWQRESHPLGKLAGLSALESALFVFQACLATPIIEEVVFRGVLLYWVIGGRKPSPVPDVPVRIRPWLVVVFALIFAGLSFRNGIPVYSGRDGATIFALLMIVGLAVIDYCFRSKRRTLDGIYSSAALFAAVHSSVWPSPIPLFLFGLGLGWLAVKTRSVLVPIIVHGLFNAVSTVYVLRSAA